MQFNGMNAYKLEDEELSEFPGAFLEEVGLCDMLLSLP